MNKENIFNKIDYILLNSEIPSVELINLIEQNYFNQEPFDLILKLKNTDQSPIHHKEGNVLNHTLMVINEGAKIKYKSKNPRIFMWSLFLHDIGKLTTTKIRKGKITSYNHDKVGYEIAKNFLKHSNFDAIFIEKVSKLVRWHMQVLFISKNLPFADLDTMKKEVDINEIALVSLCDRIGRKDIDKSQAIDHINKFLKIANS